MVREKFNIKNYINLPHTATAEDYEEIEERFNNYLLTSNGYIKCPDKNKRMGKDELNNQIKELEKGIEEDTLLINLLKITKESIEKLENINKENECRTIEEFWTRLRKERHTQRILIWGEASEGMGKSTLAIGDNNLYNLIKKREEALKAHLESIIPNLSGFRNQYEYMLRRSRFILDKKETQKEIILDANDFMIVDKFIEDLGLDVGRGHALLFSHFLNYYKHNK